MTDSKREELDLDALEAVAKAATPGPWTHQPYGGQNQNGDYFGGDVFDGDGEYLVSEVSDENGAHIATFDPATVLALIAAARPAPVEGGERDALEEWSFEHRPILSMRDGSIASCKCMDRVFSDGEDWDRHIADSVLAAGFHLTGEPEWEYGIKYSPGYEEFEGWSRGHHEQQVAGIRANGGPYAKTARVIRRIVAGPSEPVPVNQEGTGR